MPKNTLQKTFLKHIKCKTAVSFKKTGSCNALLTKQTRIVFSHIYNFKIKECK